MMSLDLEKKFNAEGLETTKKKKKRGQGSEREWADYPRGILFHPITYNQKD